MMADNKINVRIPDGTGYGLSDIEAKAKGLGLNKSEFIMAGIDLVMNLDDATIAKAIKKYKEKSSLGEFIADEFMV